MSNESDIKGFQGAYRFLSNFYPAEIPFQGRMWPTVEHAYQAAKAVMAGDERLAYLIAQARSPGDAKRLGRRVLLGYKLAKWEENKVSIMRGLVRRKFRTNENLGTLLLSTGSVKLIEGNRWGDSFWGFDLVRGIGENKLGQILMEIRDELVKINGR